MLISAQCLWFRERRAKSYPELAEGSSFVQDPLQASATPLHVSLAAKSTHPRVSTLPGQPAGSLAPQRTPGGATGPPPPNRDCKQTAPSRSSPEASQLIPSFSLADLLVFQEPPQVLVSTVPLPILNNSTHPIHKSSCLCRFSTERVLSSFSRPHLLAKSGLPTHPFQFWFWTRCFYVQACFLVCRVPRLYTSSLRTVTQGAGLAHPCSGPNFSLLPLPRDS